MLAIFQKKNKKGQKRAKYLKIWAKVYKIWKYFEKGYPHAHDYYMHETARMCPGNAALSVGSFFMVEGLSKKVDHHCVG